MGFSYIKSKLTTCNSIRSSFSSNIAFHNATSSSSSRFCPTLMVTRNFTKFAVAPLLCFYGTKTDVYTLMYTGLKNTTTTVSTVNWSMTLRQCMRSCRNNWVKLLLGAGILFTVCFVRIERIPYSRRFHVALTGRVEEFLGELQWQDFKNKNQGNIRRLSDRKSNRIESIGTKIIRAMNSGLRLDHECKINGRICASEGFCKDLEPISSDHDAAGGEWEWEGDLVSKNQILCQEGFLKHRELLWKPTTKHLMRKNWEIYVVNSKEINAACLLGGRIVIFEGLLAILKSDEEIATVIGHEIGHAVARHIAEDLLRAIILMGCLIFSTISAHSYPSGIDKLMEMLQNYISRRREEEADYIGLMLMASAGYDPRAASIVYEERLDGGNEGGGINSTHPSGSKRAKLLNKPKVMEEALAVYKEVTAGYRVRSFI